MQIIAKSLFNWK